jgi:hypothetical protein
VNDHHLTELLRLNHGICLSRPTVQRLLRRRASPAPGAAGPHAIGAVGSACRRPASSSR